MTSGETERDPLAPLLQAHPWHGVDPARRPRHA